MSESSSRTPLLDFLIERLDGEELAPPRRSLEELSDVAERLVRLYLQRRQPLRRAAVAKKLATLSMNLERAAKAAAELGEEATGRGADTRACEPYPRPRPDAA